MVRPTKQTRGTTQMSKVNDEPLTENATAEVPRALFKAIGLLALTVVSAAASQLALSPVYGSIPAKISHGWLSAIASILALVAQVYYRSYLIARWQIWTPYIPIMALLSPIIQTFLFGKSALMGPSLGPLVTEICTFVPLQFLSILGAIVSLSTVQSTYSERTTTTTAIGTAFIGFIIQSFMWEMILGSIGTYFVLSRFGLQYVIAALYIVLLPSKQAAIAIIFLSYALSQNTYLPLARMTANLNQTLHSQGFSLIARQESLTGYISVLENTKEGYRVMRCDHSLLGGEWIDQRGNSLSRLGEPIYSCFVMLEAVRLVRTHFREYLRPNSEAQALVIGLGIGTSPAALISHGIQTTIVEIDPVVHQYATQYFRLPTNHTAVIEDAVTFVEDLQRKKLSQGKFDYIIHDVFTGGAEPLELFTLEFLKGLSYLLSSDGIIAINYGGDLLLESASLVVKTILTVFPRCRFFREEAASVDEVLKTDFTNMVVFCRKSKADFTFRNPKEADFLGSQARRHNLFPEYEIQAGYFDRPKGTEKLHVLRRDQTHKLAALQQGSALNHWRIMRTVMPDFVWENW